MSLFGPHLNLKPKGDTMRMMMKASIPVEFGNVCIKEGTLQRTVVRFVEKYKPESSYFISEGGLRTAIFFFDVKDSVEIPSIAEPFFMNLHADVSITPAMNLADMRSGVEMATNGSNDFSLQGSF